MPAPSLLARAKRAYFIAQNVRSFASKERELHGLPDSWADLRMLRQGFHSDKQYLYEHIDGRPHAAYVGDFERLMMRRLNGPYAPFLDNKVLFSQVFGAYLPVPRNFGLLRRDALNPLDPVVPSAPRETALLLPELPDQFVLKRVAGGGGKNIYLIDRDSDCLRVNGHAMDLDVLLERLGTATYLVTELLGQGAYATGLFPGSLNTVRVVTMQDDEGPFVGFAVQRIGTSRSAPTDNLNQGGLAAPVELADGTLGDARHLEADRVAEPHALHPETSAPITGLTVPHWERVTSMLLDALEHFPGLRYVGWDVVLGEEGLTVLEANTYPGVQVAQLHYPLRTDRRVAAFFEETTAATHPLRRAST